MNNSKMLHDRLYVSYYKNNYWRMENSFTILIDLLLVMIRKDE